MRLLRWMRKESKFYETEIHQKLTVLFVKQAYVHLVTEL